MSSTPDWHPDPLQRHRLRYWDGDRWSDWVSDGGEPILDPFTPPTRGCLVVSAAKLIVAGILLGGLLSFSGHGGLAILALLVPFTLGIGLLLGPARRGEAAHVPRWVRLLVPTILVVGGMASLTVSTTITPDPLGLSVPSDLKVDCGSVVDPGDTGYGCDREIDEHRLAGIALLGAGLVWGGAVVAIRRTTKTGPAQQ